MSTTIYNGFIIRMATLQKVRRMVFEIRPYWEREATKLLDNYIAVRRGKNSEHPFFDWLADRKRVRATMERDPFVDTDFTVTVFPDGRDLLGIVFSEHQAWIRKWFEVADVDDYAYWNNTDPPDNVSAVEWRQRERRWLKVLPRPGVPAMCGFTIDISSPHGPMPTPPKKKETKP